MPYDRLEKKTLSSIKALTKLIGGIFLEKQLAFQPDYVPDAKRKASYWRTARRNIKKHWQLHLLVIPPILFFLIFKYYPMLNAVLAFKDYNVIKGIWGSPWVEFKHFRLFFENPQFWTLVKNTIFLSGYLILAGFPIPIILALIGAFSGIFLPKQR
nr:hypothetical protein [Paenibacillus sp. p3-SID1389]